MPSQDIDGISIAYSRNGQGAPVLMIHGFPQTHAMWAPVAAALAGDGYEVVTPDLRGYGASSKPDGADDPETYSFRAMGQDHLTLMRALGFERFHLVGHDRGARVAYRLARDCPEAVLSLTLMDIVPTDHLVETCDFAMAKSYFHWTYLAQPVPFPERMIGADPDHFFEACLLGWGGASLDQFAALDAYRAAWRDTAAISAMCWDYRTGVTTDLKHDAEDDGIVRCPALVLYGASGVVGRSYDVEAVWRPRLPDLSVGAIPGGHFFVDQNSDDTLAALREFLADVARS
ncbi:alpha/beta fold hydrolase [Alphaproteobacteria bacterium GH1-50]|uniref:Alpha/beta fold hydrolase n=1 Tax=Kangsaoukella pontilimi TaxID=2691042 RepID=A0A7C9IEU1_9RHOB|nr:alpha/beta hydrolase [Kangsaoukella pontilimi]MXQ07044.1 alpha/beta fold hydrolase [Kangsaoukella pontilimi]